MNQKALIFVFLVALLIAGCDSQAKEAAPTNESTAVPTPSDIPTPGDPTPLSTEPAPDLTQSAAESEDRPASDIDAFSPSFETIDCPFSLPPDEIEGETINCGFVTVPESRTGDDENKLKLAVVIFEAKSHNPEPDPIILLSGGPGEKTAANALNVAQVLQSFREQRDLIIFDQRGVGLSEPALECPEFQAAIFDRLDEPDPEAALKLIYDAIVACRDRLVAEGHNLSAYNTTENAADVNDIRRALAYEQLNIYGGSYGTLLAQAVMRDHPQAVRSVVMGAVLPADKSFFVHVPTTVFDAVLHLVDSCTADDECEQAFPDLRQRLYGAVEQLNENPVPMTVTNPADGLSYDSLLTGDELFGNLAIFLYATDIIPILPQAIYDVSEGSYELMTQLSGTKLSLSDALSRGMMLSVFCAEDLIGVSPEDYLETRRQIPQELAGRADPEDVIEYDFFGICQNWPVEEADPSVKEPVVSDIPTLMLEGEFDPVTPLSYAQEVAEFLSSSYLYEFPAVGHDVLLSSRCARAVADKFIDDPYVEPDASCIEQMPGVAFNIPRADSGDIVLEAVTDQASGLSSVAPVGWESPAPGTYVRGENALDQTALIIDLLPMNQADFLDLITARLTLDQIPESAAERETTYFTFLLFEEQVQGVAVDIAVTLLEDEMTLMVLMQSSPDERETLFEAVFLPAVDSLAKGN